MRYDLGFFGFRIDAQAIYKAKRYPITTTLHDSDSGDHISLNSSSL